MAQFKKTFEEVKEIIDQVSFKDRLFKVLKKGDGFLIQMQYIEADVRTGKMARQHTRKWYVSPWATESEIVQTALKCVLTSQEHIGREHFRYMGEKLYGPHMNVRDLIDMVTSNRLKEERRDPPGADVGVPEHNPFEWAAIPHEFQQKGHTNSCKLCDQLEENSIHQMEEK